MRYVDYSNFSPPAAWCERASRASEELLALCQDERKKEMSNIFTKHQRIWADLKHQLAALSHSKCWYCESKQLRSDCNVDHYRPKKSPVEAKDLDHDGYWWLAFDHKNYRYCCTYCNSPRRDEQRGIVGGKGSHFPILNEANRCFSPQDIVDDEQPVLLDPTVRTDPSLLSFDPDGTAQPAYTEEMNPWFFLRADQSIKTYHLDQVALTEQRKGVCNRCVDLVSQVDATIMRCGRGSVAADARFKRILEELIEMIAPSAEYSAAARSTLRKLRSINRPWLDVVLENH